MNDERRLPQSPPQRQDLKPGDEGPAGVPGTGEATCPNCGGSGLLAGSRCPHCEGTGRIIQGIGGG